MNMDGLMGFNRYEWKYNGDLTGDVTLEIRFDLAGLQHFRDTLREASRFGGKKQGFLETFLIRRENQPINNNQLYFMHRFHQGSFICEGPPQHRFVALFSTKDAHHPNTYGTEPTEQTHMTPIG